MGRVEGKVAFITGAARGQGRSHAVRLAQEGADIIAIDICEAIPENPYDPATEEDLAETVRQVEALDRRIVAEKADVRDFAQLKAVVDHGVAELGRLDIVSANAGISGSPNKSEDIPDDEWTNMLDINLSGVWRTVKAAIPHLRAGGRGGSIVLTSSDAGLFAYENIAHYVSAKHGVVGLMRTLALELAPAAGGCRGRRQVSTSTMDASASTADLRRSHDRIAERIIGRQRELELTLAAVAAGRDIVLEGPPGTSKTTMLAAITGEWGIPLMFVEGNADLTPAKLVGHHNPARVLREDYSAENFVPGPLVEAMQQGGFLYIEEFNRAPEDTLNT
ncbi:MAG: 3-ketoacyl-ACP reductase, partial [Microbacterium sp.]|nr:3-ketoacyl-ACP reductase [Microbacterium sp.]